MTPPDNASWGVNASPEEAYGSGSDYNHLLSDIDEMLLTAFHGSHESLGELQSAESPNADLDAAAGPTVACCGGTAASPLRSRKRTFSDVCASTADYRAQALATNADAAFATAGGGGPSASNASSAKKPHISSVPASVGSSSANEDRMHRKKTRERERRQEVNDKFEELLKLVTVVETDLGLQSGGAGGPVGSNRVEQLSRAITAIDSLRTKCGSHKAQVERLLERVRRMELLAAGSAAAVPHPHPTASSQETLLKASEERRRALAVASLPPTGAMAAGAPTPGGIPTTQAPVVAGVPGVPQHPHHPMALHGHHAFPTHVPGMPGMPMVFVPMFMPPQAMAQQLATQQQQQQQQQLATQLLQQQAVSVASLEDANESSSSGAAEATAPVPAPGGAAAAVVKPNFPAGYFMPMPMPSMPQFALRALREDGPQEKPTHAMCA